MHALTEEEIRASFVNADAEEVARIAMPHDLLLTEWDYLDFLAWRDPDSARRGCIVIEREGRPTGIVLRATDPGRVRSGMCNICHTLQPGNQVALFSAHRIGEAGRRGATVGNYLCADLSCHESVRLVPPLAPSEIRGEQHVDRRLDGTHRRMRAFVEAALAEG
ncbi:hypothetical protein J2Y69_002779 [Microbacterium resistens]|uniref:Elongation factor G-binding protein C-terminal treble-clef zinc-finger domain-containing protein n=1 Tax=Microbacterium resistens TaxID=156977 RepID=A0ABU1SEY3_9MICO|nr:FBP domain-containing protein [Microbacterium resistens]MDR6868168.1 hypothetical protein [Microbacterium resistens]